MYFEEIGSDSSDEEIFNIVERVGRPRVFRQRRNPFEIYSEEQFSERYNRLSRRTVWEILEKIEEKITPTCNRSLPVSPMNQLITALRFFATGSFQIVMGDDMQIHKTTVCRIVKKVTNIIAGLSREYIEMPTREEITNVKRNFYEISRFPNVIGCVDGTHIKIQSPGGDNGELFRNRKGYFSINVQCICDASLRIRNVDARWHGSVHDSTVFENSLIKIKLEENLYRGYLLGDSAYPCKPYLLTPVANPTNADEQRYNFSHIRTRNTIERCFGVLKRRFPCLSQGMRLKLRTVVSVIVAAIVLHNIAISEGDEIQDDIENLEANEPPHPDFNLEEELHGVAVRTGVINTHFR